MRPVLLLVAGTLSPRRQVELDQQTSSCHLAHSPRSTHSHALFAAANAKRGLFNRGIKLRSGTSAQHSGFEKNADLERTEAKQCTDRKSETGIRTERIN